MLCPERLFGGDGGSKNLLPQRPLPFLGKNPKSPLNAKTTQQPNKSNRVGGRNSSVSPQKPQCDNSAPLSSDYYNNSNSNKNRSVVSINSPKEK